jgi:hypothetical protein
MFIFSVFLLNFPDSSEILFHVYSQSFCLIFLIFDNYYFKYFLSFLLNFPDFGELLFYVISLFFA